MRVYWVYDSRVLENYPFGITPDDTINEVFAKMQSNGSVVNINVYEANLVSHWLPGNMDRVLTFIKGRPARNMLEFTRSTSSTAYNEKYYACYSY